MKKILLTVAVFVLCIHLSIAQMELSPGGGNPRATVSEEVEKTMTQAPNEATKTAIAANIAKLKEGKDINQQ